MKATQQLEKYLAEHPDFWEYENETKEVTRLEALCIEQTNLDNTLPKINYIKEAC